MKRVPNHQFLYLRGGVFHFRRAVPPEARDAFGGKSEYKVSLRTGELAKARHLAARQLEYFDHTVALAIGGPALLSGDADCLASATTATVPPSSVELDAAVRRWFMSRSQTSPVPDYSAPERGPDGLARQLDLQVFSAEVRRRNGPGGGGATFAVSWTAEAIAQANGWMLPEGSEAHRHLVRTVSRGLLEAAHQEHQDIAGESRTTLDSTFSHEAYRLDELREQVRPTTKAQPLMALFDAYIAEAKPAPASIKAWRPVVRHLIAHLGHDDGRRITSDDMVAWKDVLLTEPSKSGAPRSAKTINDTYITSIKTLFRWAVENRRMETSPATGIRVRMPKRLVLRSKGLTDAEAATILRATFDDAPSQVTPERALARRWVPWICAYFGARVNEITQVRAEDFRQVEKVWGIYITPEAGSTKNHKARWVPIHSHLLDQGILSIIKDKKGPLFYDPSLYRGGDAGHPQSKKTGEHLARWVRELGVDDPNVAPNHGWRHRFKTTCRAAKIAPEVRDHLQGHRARTEGEAYGDFPVSVLKEAVERLPRYGAPSAPLPPPRARARPS